MLKIFKKYGYLIIIGFLFFLLVIKTPRCSESKVIKHTVIRKVSVPGDTIYQKIISNIREISYVQDTFTQVVDTGAILRDYMATRIFQDSLQKDSNYSLIITDTVSQNKILGRSILFKNLRPKEIQYITTEITKNPWKIYPGIHFDVGPTTADLGTSLLFIPKNDNFAYSVSYSFFHKQGRLTAFYKLRFK